MTTLNPTFPPQAIKAEMGDNVEVVHKCGMPLTMKSTVDGKKSKVECVPAYYVS